MNRLRLVAPAIVSTALFCGVPSWGQGLEGLIGDPVNYDLGAADAESIDLALNGRLIFATVPEPVPDVEEEAFNARLRVLLHVPQSQRQVFDLLTADLGPGEITDVAAHSIGTFAIVNIREDDVNAVNQLAVLRGGHVVSRIDLGAPADGIGLSPDDRHLVVAVEKGEAIDVYEVGPGGKSVELAASIGRNDFLPFFAGEEARLAEEDIEPESVTFTPDGSLALVSLQEQSSIAVVDMTTLALANIVHLPFGFLDTRGDVVGVEPDGLGVSPDGSFALVANEGGSRSRHLMGISLIDLRGGAAAIPTPTTWCIFDLDPSLLEGTGLESCPGAGPGGEAPAEHNALPRLDPNNVKIVERGGRLVAAVNIERRTAVQDRGSVLFLDVTGILDGGAPGLIARKLVGRHPGARPEGMATAEGGRFLWVACQDDGGTIARFELGE